MFYVASRIFWLEIYVCYISLALYYILLNYLKEIKYQLITVYHTLTKYLKSRHVKHTYHVGLISCPCLQYTSLNCKMEDKLECIYKEFVIAWPTYYPENFLEGLKETNKNLSQDSWCSCRDSNWAPPNTSPKCCR